MSETITTSAPAPPTTAEELEEKLRKIQVVDVSDAVSAHAIDAAERHINEETTQHGVRGFIKRVLVGNIGRDFVRQRHINQNREQIIESGNIYDLEEGATQDTHNTAVASTVTRFTDEFIHTGEENQSFEDTERGSQLLGDIRGLVREYAEGRMNLDALEEEKNRILQEYGQHVHDQDRNRGLMFADNILEVAQYARMAREHGLALDRIDQVLSGNIGEARMGVRSEAHLTAVDRTLDRLHHLTGGVLNEGTVGLAVAAAITIGKFTSRSAASAALRPLTMGASAGIWAGLREHLRVGQERSAHAREMAEGGEINETEGGNSRRERMEATRYETVPAAQLIAGLEGVPALLESGNVQAVVAAITEAQMRISMSDQRSIDLISYSSKTSVEEERLSLDFRLAEAKVLLNRRLTTMDDGELAAAGLTTRDGAEAINNNQTALAEVFAEDIDEKDAAFRKLRRNRTLKMAAIAGVGGIVLGLGVQEIKALASDGLRGIFETSGGNRDSLLAAFANRLGFGGQSNDLHREFFEGGHHMHDVAVDLPHGYHLQPGHPGEKLGWSILGPDGQPVVKHLEWDTQGNLSKATRHLLHEKGLDLVQHNLKFREPTLVGHDVLRSPHEYLAHHPHEFVRAHRQLWYDNDTPGVFDHNELKLDWGSNGVGIDQNGNYILNVGHMTPDGSWHEGLSTDAQTLVHEGKMAIALSMSKDTQQFVHMVSIDQNGNALIPHDSYLAHSLFENQGGHAKFIGGYAEAVQMMGKTPDGGESMRMLATVVGENSPHNATDIAHHLVMHTHEHFVTAVETNNPVEIPPVVPIYSRRGLEAVRPGVGLGNLEVGRSYYSGKTLAELRSWVKADPNRLRPRHKVSSKDNDRTWMEADGSEVKRDVLRERETIKKYLDKEKVRNAEAYALSEKIADAMEPMSDECRVAVNVPAWMEEKNLRNFLEQYTNQVDKSGNKLDIKFYEVNILVNRKTGVPEDASMSVIQDFINQFEKINGFKPKVNYYNIELNPPNNNVGYARKLLTDAVMIRNLKRSGQTHALYIETEDADMINVDPKTVANVIDKMDSNPQLDAVRGVQDRAPEYMKDNDMLFIRRRAWDFFEIMSRDKRFRDPRNPNWNFTFNRIVTGGWNSAYSAEAYALIEGYDSVQAGEDMSVGERITMVRGDGTVPNLEVIGKVPSRSDASPRRFIHEIRADKAAYDDFGNEEDNQIIREQSLDEAMGTISKFKRITPENESEFSRYIESYYDAARSVTPSKADADQFTQRLLFWIGFQKDDYELSDAGLKIKNWNNVREALEGYRERYEGRHSTAKTTESRKRTLLTPVVERAQRLEERAARFDARASQRLQEEINRQRQRREQIA